jgi:dTMP kinase
VLITFEGIDRSGKTTQARLLAGALGGDAVLVREPGGTPAAERIRSLVKDPAVELSPLAEALLFEAARAELVSTVIRPALEEGRTVICDRYVDSTAAYQGGARGLGIETIERLSYEFCGDPVPDLTILLALDPEPASERPGERDRFEREGEALQRAVAAAYEELAGRHPERYVRVDGARPADEVHRDVMSAVSSRT